MDRTRELFTPAVKGMVAALGGDMVLKALGLAATFITLQVLDPFQYGLWQLLLSVAGAFGFVTIPGIASMLVAEVSREYGAGRKREGNGIAVRAAGLFVLLSACGALCMMVAAPFIKELSGIDIVRIAQILAVSVFAIGVRQAYGLALHSRMQFFHVQSMKVLDRFSYLVWIVVFLGYLQYGVEGVVYAYVLSNLTSVVCYAPYILSLYREMYANQAKDDWQPFVTSSWDRGKWVMGTDFVNTFTGTVWPWVVGYFLDVEAVGIIGITILLLGQVASFVPVSYVLRSILPRTSETPERMREWLYRSMKFSMWGHMLSGIMAFAACVVVFPWWFPQHSGAIPLFAVLLLSLPLRGLTTSVTEWFYATGNQRDLFFVSALPKLAITAFLPLFLWAGGMMGYALWYLLSTDVVLLSRLARVSRALGARFGIREIVILDRVDMGLLARGAALITSKITARFAR